MKLCIVFALTLAFIVLDTSANDVGNVISASQFEKLLKHRNDGACEGKGFYTYNAFLTAARSFDGFGTTGGLTTRKRELAAFLAQTSHETTGGNNDSWDGPYTWGYCLITEKNKASTSSYCDPGTLCTPGKSYYGRGPIQLKNNYNYNQAGKALNLDLINNPDIVARDAVISFKTAIWFWMTPQGNKPSSHDVITNKWTPCAADKAANRVPGFGVITNIFNGGVECGHGPADASGDRIGFYKKYCDVLGLPFGPNLDCDLQQPFAV